MVALYKVKVFFILLYKNYHIRKLEREIKALVKTKDLGMKLPDALEIDWGHHTFHQTVKENGKTVSEWDINVDITGRGN